MKTKMVWILIFLVVLFGCSREEDKKGLEKAQILPPILDLKKQAPSGVFLHVNGKNFKKADFNKKFEEIWDRYKGEVPKASQDEYKKSLKAELIERLIIKTLCEEEAERRGIKVTEEEVEKEWARMKKQFPDEQKWKDFVKRSGLERENIATALLISKLIEEELGPHKEPTAKEIRAYYDSHLDSFTKPERAHIRHILIAVKENEDELSRRAKREKIEAIRKEIMQGKDFSQAAREYSDCPSKVRGGDLGEILRRKEEDAFSQAVFRQKVGEIGPVIESSRGFHLIQVLEKKPKERLPFSRVKKHIEEMLRMGKKNEAFALLMARLKKNAVIIKFENP